MAHGRTAGEGHRVDTAFEQRLPALVLSFRLQDRAVGHDFGHVGAERAKLLGQMTAGQIAAGQQEPRTARLVRRRREDLPQHAALLQFCHDLLRDELFRYQIGLQAVFGQPRGG